MPFGAPRDRQAGLADRKGFLGRFKRPSISTIGRALTRRKVLRLYTTPRGLAEVLKYL
jgi:hypothetical protein